MVKQNLFARLGALTRPGTLLATNTSTPDLVRLASTGARLTEWQRAAGGRP